MPPKRAHFLRLGLRDPLDGILLQFSRFSGPLNPVVGSVSSHSIGNTRISQFCDFALFSRRFCTFGATEISERRISSRWGSKRFLPDISAQEIAPPHVLLGGRFIWRSSGASRGKPRSPDFAILRFCLVLSAFLCIWCHRN